jgi:vacuolar-type H+-ATPase subunit D/Vma8
MSTPVKQLSASIQKLMTLFSRIDSIVLNKNNIEEAESIIQSIEEELEKASQLVNKGKYNKVPEAISRFTDEKNKLKRRVNVIKNQSGSQGGRRNYKRSKTHRRSNRRHKTHKR